MLILIVLVVFLNVKICIGEFFFVSMLILNMGIFVVVIVLMIV